MENVDRWLDVLTKHWKIILAVLAFFMWGGYLIARNRISGMSKLVRANSEILDEMDSRLGKLRIELDNTRQELSIARARGYESAAEVARLSEKVSDLEAREVVLIAEIEKYQNAELDK